MGYNYPMKIYTYKNCSGCKKALKYLEKNNIKFNNIEITEKPPSLSELKTMLESMEGKIGKLFNTSGQMYRELNMKEKLKTMGDSEALQLLSENGKLIKRPFLLSQSFNTTGFKEDLWNEHLL